MTWPCFIIGVSIALVFCAAGIWLGSVLERRHWQRTARKAEAEVAENVRRLNFQIVAVRRELDLAAAMTEPEARVPAWAEAKPAGWGL